MILSKLDREQSIHSATMYLFSRGKLSSTEYVLETVGRLARELKEVRKENYELKTKLREVNNILENCPHD